MGKAAYWNFPLKQDENPVADTVGIWSQNPPFGVGCVQRAFPVGYDPSFGEVSHA
jgi:hypothetical protein